MSNSEFEHILSDIRQFAQTARDLAAVQEFCVSRIAARLPHYNWAGFYMLDRKDPVGGTERRGQNGSATRGHAAID